METETGNLPLSHKPRKSEVRQKQRRYTFRVTQGEYCAIEEAAAGAGVTIGTYIRDSVLKNAETGRRRRPTFEVNLLAALLGNIRKSGSNIYQVLRRVNFGEMVTSEELKQAAEHCYAAADEMITVIRGQRP